MAAKIVPSKPLLIMLYGFPGAGKTYFARNLTEHLQAAHVHGDRIRGELFDNPQYDKEENGVITQLMDYMTHEFLNAGISVVYDANAMRNAQRHALREMARKASATSLLVWLQVDADGSFARIGTRDRRRMDDKYAASLDRNAFDNIATHMQNPQNVEDYVVISGKHTFNTQFSAIVKRLQQLGLIRAEDTVNSKLAKPELVNLVPNPMAGRVDMSRRNITIR
jgi:predicted kinase